LDADYQDFKYIERTEKIINIFYKVYNRLGYGFLEKVYENALMIEFKKEGIPAVSQSAIKVLYEGEIIGEYYADINKVIVEIKATDIEIGLLLNFGTKPELKRKAFDNSRK